MNLPHPKHEGGIKDTKVSTLNNEGTSDWDCADKGARTLLASVTFLLLHCVTMKLPQPNQQPKTIQNNFCWGGIIIG